jgi:hypothetical protein
VVPPGYRLALSVLGQDHEYTGDLDRCGQNFVYATRGTGAMTHADPDDRPEAVFCGSVTIPTWGPDHPSKYTSPQDPTGAPRGIFTSSLQTFVVYCRIEAERSTSP